MTGHCKSRPELMENGKLRMHEEWEWTSKDESKGKSIIEEIPIRESRDQLKG
jgi:hypothetical protein